MLCVVSSVRLEPLDMKALGNPCSSVLWPPYCNVSQAGAGG